MTAVAALTDSHCHLNMPEFDSDLDAVLKQAQEQGVTRILIPGLDLPSSKRAIELAQAHPGLYAAIGIHPQRAKDWKDDTLAALRELAAQPKVVAIGEIGLDYVRTFSEPPVQRRVFRAQLELAAELHLPVVIHNREASADLFEMLLPWSDFGPGGRVGVLHAYSAGLEEAHQAIEAGFFLGIGGPLTFRNAQDLRQLVSSLPLERICIETDAPYLTPQPHRGKRNEPAYVRFVAQGLTELGETDYPTVARVTSHNAAYLFGWNEDGTNLHNLH
jgi:TatD DNase family protein